MVARPQLDAVAVADGNAPQPVELALEDPVGARRLQPGVVVDECREHGRAPGCDPPRPGARIGIGCDVLDHPTGQRGGGLGRLDVQGRVGPLVAALDQDPVVAPGPGERPAAVELRPVEPHGQVAVVDPLPHAHGRGVVFGEVAIGPRVPDDHGSGAVVPTGDVALERAIVERVVLDVHGETLDLRVVGRALGHGPRRHHAVDLEPEVVVEAAGMVLLHDERRPGAAAHLAARLGGAVESSLLLVAPERIVSHTHHAHDAGR